MAPTGQSMTSSPGFVAVFLTKAAESLACAESEYVNGRFNTCANRCYYACFQAAVAALAGHSITPPGGSRAQWAHGFVQAQFVTQLIDRRKVYPASVRDTLNRIGTLRRSADYTTDEVSQTQAERALRRARTFVQTIQGGGGRS
jgi:uncharacterized protein (UPF0332 family)